MSTTTLKNRRLSKRDQSGATLIVALVLLAVITVIGLASIRSSNLELKMASSAQDRAVALDYAESGIEVVKRLLDVRFNGELKVEELKRNTNLVDPNDIATENARIRTVMQNAWPQLSSFQPNCAALSAGKGLPDSKIADGNQIQARCFTEQCDNGLCFTGDLAVPTKALCRLENPSTGTVLERWKEQALWNNANRYGTIQVAGAKGNQVDVKYVVEMLCFTPRSDRTMEDPDLANGVPLYRITARAQGDSKRAEVVLQTTYKGNIL